MKIYEAFNWIKDADYTPHGFLIFNENTPEGQLKGEALKTIFEAAKNGELVTLEMFEAVKKERNEAVKRRNELLNLMSLRIRSLKQEKGCVRSFADIRMKSITGISHRRRWKRYVILIAL